MEFVASQDLVDWQQQHPVRCGIPRPLPTDVSTKPPQAFPAAHRQPDSPRLQTRLAGRNRWLTSWFPGTPKPGAGSRSKVDPSPLASFGDEPMDSLTRLAMVWTLYQLAVFWRWSRPFPHRLADPFGDGHSKAPHRLADPFGDGSTLFDCFPPTSHKRVCAGCDGS